MKEYQVICIQNGGTPFQIGSYYTSLDECIAYVNRLAESREEKRIYTYVDNLFYENKFPMLACKFYLQIREREVTSWKQAQNNNEEKNNIIFLQNVLTK